MMPSLSSLILSVSAAAPAAALPAAPPCVDETTNLLQRKEFASALTAAEHCLARTEHPRSLYLAGAVLLGGLRGFNHLNTDASPDALLWEARFKNGAIGSAGWYALGGGLVGAGIGLGASAALGLLVQQLVPARSAAAWPVRSQGLAIAF